MRILSSAANRTGDRRALQWAGCSYWPGHPLWVGLHAPQPENLYGPNAHAFGHGGYGGSLGFADPDAKVGFGYVMNKMLMPPDVIDPRWAPLIDALYASL
jgi:CubicO group peptidase (beta-lactamase class C family)